MSQVMTTAAKHQEYVATLRNIRNALVQKLGTDAHWEGRLSSSALSTAVSVVALGSINPRELLAREGLAWLARNQNADGGWGDTPDSPSNISTTLLCWAAFHHLTEAHSKWAESISRAEQMLSRELGNISPEEIANRVLAYYGKDRTFSVPILTLCAICGRLGKSKSAWEPIPQLPFELAALPHQVFQWLRLPVVSYAIPALIAMGLARHENGPGNFSPLRPLRQVLRPTVLKVLQRIQPTSGGFLEAVPLTGFVVMALAASGLREHPVTKIGAEFLRNSKRSDGSWPIDVNLSTWLTALSVASLASCRDGLELLDSQNKRKIRDWFLGQQHLVEHPFTHAQPGGWAWTDLPGGVPDGDDTSGVLLALHHLDPNDRDIREAVIRGVRWLLDLQNRDGGVPTFCRGWMELPFDRSCPDITAHAIAAWLAWKDRIPGPLGTRAEAAVRQGVKYLASSQRPNGTWIPLWFGNQHATRHENPLYGTARVLICLEHLSPALDSLVKEKLNKARSWILANQQEHGGWGATKESPATIEETSLALQALSTNKAADRDVLRRGVDWIAQATEQGILLPPSPIGLYFSKLWYSEELYPLVFSCAGMARALRIILP